MLRQTTPVLRLALPAADELRRWTESRARYAGEISYVDEEMGRLLDYLRRRGILDEAILLLTSDHGENLGEHGGLSDHGWTTYQSTLRVVGLVRLPGARARGTKVHQLVANIDLLAALLQYLVLPLPEDIDGEPFDLSDPESSLAPRVRFGQATRPPGEADPPPRWRNLRNSRCVRDGPFKYMETRAPRLRGRPGEAGRPGS